ncbi:cell wall hydrolase [Paenibacillus beijingensis]|uniref:Spore cortex-lytic protein n=1 Tax=Paenibacillus beijingensis TaxID=1126833 RepID=A0A0D5NJG4_9BACL|nr:cell wall hydrolase [Paenibacillus beijingensis]AJY75411.1 hypothetical protein VN24_13575 [Paenibacillus beijingensis]
MHRFFALLALIVLVAAATVHDKASAAVAPVMKVGSKGPQVKDLQFRLQTLGFFHVPLTTTYGTITKGAVKRFQQHHGLSADGVAGPRTWAKLKKVSVSRNELVLMARVIYGEARGEHFKGQVAVGAVIMNRLQSPLFPNTIKEIIMEPNAFSVIDDGQYLLTPDLTSIKAAKAAVKGMDPTGNALFYYNPKISKSSWFKTRTATTKIGNHLFTV